MLVGRFNTISFQNNNSQPTQLNADPQSNPLNTIDDKNQPKRTKKVSTREWLENKIKSYKEKWHSYNRKQDLIKAMKEFAQICKPEKYMPGDCCTGSKGYYYKNDKYNPEKCKDAIDKIKDFSLEYDMRTFLTGDYMYIPVFYALMHEPNKPEQTDKEKTAHIGIVKHLVDFVINIKSPDDEETQSIQKEFYFQKWRTKTPYQRALESPLNKKDEAISLKLVDLLEKLSPEIQEREVLSAYRDALNEEAFKTAEKVFKLALACPFNEKDEAISLKLVDSLKRHSTEIQQEVVLPAYNAAIEAKAFKTAGKLYNLAEESNLTGFPYAFKNAEMLSNINK